MVRRTQLTNHGKVMAGTSRVASTVPWRGQRPRFVCVSAAMTQASSAAARQPAEAAQGDQQSAQAPGCDDQQVGPGEPAPVVWGL
jgi:hypothetical protein